MKEVPYWTMVGPNRDHFPPPSYFVNADQMETVERFPDELPRSAERMAQLQSITQAIGDFAADLDIGIAPEKIPNPERFHFFADPKALKSAAGLKTDNPNHVLTGCSDRYNLYVLETDDTPRTLRIASHEVTHFMAYESRRPKIHQGEPPIFEPVPIRNGYLLKSETPRFELLNEWIAELSSLFTSTYYWPRYSNLPANTDSFSPAGYSNLLIIGEEILNKATAYHGLTRLTIFQCLARGSLTGEMCWMRLLSQALGTSAFRAVVHAGIDPSADLVTKMGVPEANKQLESFYKTGTTRALGWM